MSLFIYAEHNLQQDFECAASRDMQVVYACIEMLESLFFACLRVVHLPEWRHHLSGV